MLRNRKEDWDSKWTNDDYSFYSQHGDPENKPIGIHFLCPGCGSMLAIEIQTDEQAHPRWIIDFEKLTAKPSILHSRPNGCGWHGYLTNGELVGKVE